MIITQLQNINHVLSIPHQFEYANNIDIFLIYLFFSAIYETKEDDLLYLISYKFNSNDNPRKMIVEDEHIEICANSSHESISEIDSIL